MTTLRLKLEVSAGYTVYKLFLKCDALFISLYLFAYYCDRISLTYVVQLRHVCCCSALRSSPSLVSFCSASVGSVRAASLALRNVSSASG